MRSELAGRTPPSSPIVRLGLGLLLVAAGTLLPTTGASAAPQVPTVGNDRQWPLDPKHFDATRLWQLSDGAGVTVAVLDSGVDARHPDLTGQVLPGVDLTGHAVDGQVDTSDDSHGTSVAGVVAGTGKGDSGHGVVGLAPRAKILPVRVADGEAADPVALAQGIGYAAAHGAGVINISSTMLVLNPQVQEAVAAAQQHDVVVVAATGNRGLTGDPTPYPAALPGVVAVSGSDASGGFWAKSGSGAYVALAAPAVSIYTTDNRGGYLTANGTSYAAPFVSAAAALLRSRYPTESAGQIIDRLVRTADQRDGGRTVRFGYGVVDPFRALTATRVAASNPLLQPFVPQTNRHTAVPVGLLSGAGAATAVLVAAGIVWRRRRTRSAPPPAAGPKKSQRPAKARR